MNFIMKEKKEKIYWCGPNSLYPLYCVLIVVLY